jgi:hypothetical protein
VKVGISLDPSLHAWALDRIGEGREFATLTHALERGLAALRTQETARAASDEKGKRR